MLIFENPVRKNYEEIVSSLYDTNLVVLGQIPIKLRLLHCLSVTVTNNNHRWVNLVVFFYNLCCLYKLSPKNGELHIMTNARHEVSKQASNWQWKQDLCLLWLAAVCNYNNIMRKWGETCDVLRLFLKISYNDFSIILGFYFSCNSIVMKLGQT